MGEKIHDDNVIQLINMCEAEFMELRRQIGVLKPKAEAYDAIRVILDLLPGPSQGYAEDIVWKLRKLRDELTAVEIVGE